jgi:hypothetical protein
MLPRADAPARRLPYTTADMSERLAKKKAEQDAAEQAKANQALRYGVTNPPVKEDKGGGGGLWPSWKELGNAAKIGGKGVIGMVNTIGATPIDIADEAVQGLERLVGVTPTDKFDPASVGSFNLLGETYRGVDRAAQYVGQQIAATPGFGKPSSSPFMDTLRSKGLAEAIAEPFVHAVNVGSVAYPVSKMAVGAKLPKTIADAYRQRLLERDIAAQNNLFPAVQRPANVIDVDALQGSRLPARVVDSPAPPATRLAEAQTQRALTPQPVAPAVEIVKLPWSKKLPNSRVVKYTEPHLDEYGNLLKNGRNITLKVLDKNTKNMTGAMNIDIDFATQTATLEMMGVVDEFTTPQLAAAALHELKQFDFLKSQYPLIPSPNIPRPLIEQLQQAGLIDPSYQIPTPGPQNAFDAVQGPNFVNEWQFHEELVPQNYQPYFDSIMESLSPTKVLEPNFVISSPDAAHYFIANGGALDKVPPQYLWQSVQDNGFEGGRFKKIGSAGGHIGMDRYVDQATGQHFGLKYRPQYRFLFKNPKRQSNGFYTSDFQGPLGEILSNEVAVALGFPNMNLRLIVNGDESVSIITDLAQDVYGGKIIDSFEAGSRLNPNNDLSPIPADFVPVEDRIRMAVLDLLIDNGDRNTSNVLFSVDETGGIRLVPIDHEITFFPAHDSGIGYPAAMNFSVRRAYKDDPTKLFEPIKAIITKIQDDLQNSQIVKRFESKLLETTKKVGIDFTDLNAADKWDFDSQIQAFENKVKAFLSESPEDLAQEYIKQIEGYMQP